ncbi:MAG TPA: tetratricopeptide repeat protein [Pyrinomonadaceae bacterium]|nr:tetratricopeptide repeat protein [Pyrinomonadaceae bacterium]
MFKARIFATCFLLAGLHCAIVQAQDDSGVRPRRSQIEGITSAKPPSRAAMAEARKLYKAGEKYGDSGRFAEAARSFEQALKLDPEYADAYLGLGHAYYDLHQWEPAIENLQRSLDLKPKDKFAADLLTSARSMLERDAPKPLVANVADASLSKTTTARSKPDESALTAIYRVGPGDVLDVRLTDAVSTEPALFTVTSAGLLEHPDLSAPLPSAGLTVEEISARMSRMLRQSNRPNVSVAVNEYVSHTILVSGLVKEPGTKIIRREAIPLYVVVADAQPLPEAGAVTVLRHNPRESYVVDLAKNSEMNLLVRPGDVITVQPGAAQFFYVSGEVRSPGEKSFHPGLTLTQAIIIAGGLTKESKEARLARDNGKGYLVVNRYKLKDVNSGKLADPVLQPGDRITVVK